MQGADKRLAAHPPSPASTYQVGAGALLALRISRAIGLTWQRGMDAPLHVGFQHAEGCFVTLDRHLQRV